MEFIFKKTQLAGIEKYTETLFWCRKTKCSQIFYELLRIVCGENTIWSEFVDDIGRASVFSYISAVRNERGVPKANVLKRRREFNTVNKRSTGKYTRDFISIFTYIKKYARFFYSHTFTAEVRNISLLCVNNFEHFHKFIDEIALKIII